MKSIIKKYFFTELYLKADTRAIFTLYGVVWKEFTSAFPQFFTWAFPITSFFRSIKYTCFALRRIVLGKSIKLSYGFTGEDRIIESLLKPIITSNGFYVDVGANDPRFLSNTFSLYKRGWRGICVDANQKLIDKHLRIRPRDKAVCALVSDSNQEHEFFILTNNVLSSADVEHTEGMQRRGQAVVSKKTVMSKTLTQILIECHAPQKFELLSIDIEEFDYRALTSFDFSRFRPKLIVVEAEEFNAAHPAKHPIFILLTSHGYRFMGSILSNLYFKDES